MKQPELTFAVKWIGRNTVRYQMVRTVEASHGQAQYKTLCPAWRLLTAEEVKQLGYDVTRIHGKYERAKEQPRSEPPDLLEQEEARIEARAQYWLERKATRRDDQIDYRGDTVTGKLLPLGYTMPGAAEQIEQLLRDPSVLLIDIRYRPASRLAPWRQAALQAKYGERYIWLGEQLGNVNYKSSGPITIAHPESGVSALLSYLDEGYCLILLCACKDYEWCHRKVVCELVRDVLPEVEIIL